MADEHDPERLRRRFARTMVDPRLFEDLAAREADANGAGRRGPPAPPRAGATGTRSRGGSGFSMTAAPAPEPTVRVIMELNADFPGGIDEARSELLAQLSGMDVGDRLAGGRGGRRYVFASLTRSEIERLSSGVHPARAPTSTSEAPSPAPSPIRRLWRDEPLRPLLDRSIRTVKADACMATFGADGRGIVVAVADSGIDGTHPHFAEHRNLLDLPAGVGHGNFISADSPLEDQYGHGTHVAGIVAGRTSAERVPMKRVVEVRDAATDSVQTVVQSMPCDAVLRGVAPRAKLVSLKVLDATGRGYSSALIEALEYVHDANDAGRSIRIHCVNLSLGYPFDAEWFAAGHSPLCEVVDRLSRSGVVVVAAAGNDGSMLMQTEGRADRQRIGLAQSINDPGNAEEAITVGSTHAEAPHRYGVSWFSSRGPTADGRVKPDLVAPGERILSCAALRSGKLAAGLDDAEVEAQEGTAYFREESGTSMAAPHVAGAVAALLSARSEFIGRSAEIKSVLLRSCTDLRRKEDFQGAGLLDLLRAVQSV